MNLNRIRLLEKYILEEPDNSFNQYALAMEYYEGDEVKALTLLSELQNQNPTYLPTYFKLAHLLWENEKWEEAEIIFEKGIRLSKEQNDKKAYSELKVAYQNFLFEKE